MKVHGRGAPDARARGSEARPAKAKQEWAPSSGQAQSAKPPRKPWEFKEKGSKLRRDRALKIRSAQKKKKAR